VEYEGVNEQGWECTGSTVVVGQELDLVKMVAITHPALKYPEPLAAHRLYEESAVLKLGEISNLQQCTNATVARPVLYTAHADRTGAVGHCPPDHETVTRLKDVKWERRSGECNPTHKHRDARSCSCAPEKGCSSGACRCLVDHNVSSTLGHVFGNSQVEEVSGEGKRGAVRDRHNLRDGRTADRAARVMVADTDDARAAQ
jgi:hypothetical protein